MMMKMTQRTIRSDYDDDHDSDFFKWFLLDLLQQIFNILKKEDDNDVYALGEPAT